MRYELKSVGIWAFTKVAFFFNLIIGFVFGLFYALLMGFFMAVMSSLPFIPAGDFDVHLDYSFGFLVIILPIIIAVAGAIFYTVLGVISVGVYNLVARVTGGIEFVLNPLPSISAPQPLPVQAQPIQPAPAPPSQMPTQAIPPPPPPILEPPSAPPPQPPSPASPPEKPDDDRFKPPESGGP